MKEFHGLPTADMGVTDVLLLHPENPQQGGIGLAFVAGDVHELADRESVPIRIQSSCRFGEIAGSLDCDCGPQLAASRLALQGGGVLFYLDQEGRGAGIEAKMEAMALQQREDIDTWDAYAALGLPFDQRDYGHVAWTLADLGLNRVTVATNNYRKTDGLIAGGITVVDRTPLIVGVVASNIRYLETKARKAGHKLPTDLEAYLDK